MSKWGLYRWPASPSHNTRAGHRLLVPIFLWRLRGYDIMQDMFVDGWWVLTIGATFAALDIYGLAAGFSIRASVGFVPTKWTVESPSKEWLATR